MKYEDLIRKIFKNYKSKRELKKDLEYYSEYFRKQPVKIVGKPLDFMNVKCCRYIDPYDINLLNQQEKDAAYERIIHDMQREMFDYIVDSKAFKFYREFDNYEYKEKFVGFIQVVK